MRIYVYTKPNPTHTLPQTQLKISTCPFCQNFTISKVKKSYIFYTSTKIYMYILTITFGLQKISTYI